MALRFSEVANKKSEDIERPPLPPVGTYLWNVTKIPTITENVKDQWDIVEYQVKGVAAQDDVDAEAIAAYGNVTNIQNRIAFMFDTTDPAKFAQTEYNHKRFLEEHLKCWEEGMSLKEAMNNAVNHQFLGTIKWAPDKNDPEIYHANIGKTAPVE